MPAYRVKLLGLKGVMNTIRSLPVEMKAGRIIRNALKAGAQVIQKEAQANVKRIVLEPNAHGLTSHSTGALELSINIKRRAPEGGKNGEAQSVGIGKLGKVARKKLTGEAGDPRYYAWFLEFGTERMRPHPFMRPAYEAKKEVALAKVVERINIGLKNALKKLQQQNRVLP